MSRVQNRAIPDRYNASELLDRNLEAGRGGKTAIRWGDQERTYAEVHAASCRAGRALLAMGCAPGDRVLLVLDDRPVTPSVFLGAIRAGLVPIPVNPLYGADE